MGHIQDAEDNFVDSESSPLLGSRLGRTNCEGSDSTSKGQVNVNLVGQLNKSRWRSIRVMYLTVFLGAITFSITMSSLWPFLQVLDPSTKSNFLGWVVAAYSLGQFFASPLFGGWANRRGTSKEPLTVSLVLMVLSNMFYTYLQSLPDHRDVYMIVARGLIGFSAGNIAVVRSYLSAATTVEERTGAMANLSIAQAMGFILGPVFQSILVFIKYPGPEEVEAFHFNMYTAPAFFAACVALINLVLVIFVFKEYKLNDDMEEEKGHPVHTQAIINGNASPPPEKDYNLDLVAVWSSVYLFFVVLFMFTVFETIGTPLTMHMYAWDKSKATFYQGIFLGSGGLLSIAVFAVTKRLAKKYDERYLLLCGFLFCFLGYFAFIPWGDKLPPRSFAPIANNSRPHHNLTATRWLTTENESVHIKNLIVSMNIENNSTYHNDNRLAYQTNQPKSKPQTNPLTRVLKTLGGSGIKSESDSADIVHDSFLVSQDSGHSNSSLDPSLGCPWQYSWCGYVPVIPLFQYIIASILITVGYPMCNMLTYTIYSKVLGPKPQGLWMGWLTASGSLARTVGPVYVSQIYNSFGPQVTYGSITGYILLTILFLGFVFRRLVPFKYSFDPRTPLLFGVRRIKALCYCGRR